MVAGKTPNLMSRGFNSSQVCQNKKGDMMRDPYYLTPELNNHQKIFKKVKVGDLIQYSLFHTLIDIFTMASDYGILLECIPSSTRKYKKFGYPLLRVVKKHRSQKKDRIKPVLFNPKMLTI